MSAPRRSRSGFGARLLGAQALVMLAGAATTWVVASQVAPGIFHTHLRRAGVAHSASETDHVERAFGSALLISISIALVAATAAAFVVTWYFTRRVQRSIDQVASAAAQVAEGHYDTRVADPGLGREFATLVASSNTLAERIRRTEESRRQLLADLAHEMRTPVATIDAHLEAIEDGVRVADDETLAVIRLSTQRLRRLAEDVASVSRAEEGRLAVDRRLVPAVEIARAAAGSAADRFAAAGVALDVAGATPARVEADPDRLGQVLGNLLDNALRHTEPGGTVRLECTASDDEVTYVVADTGSGISAEHLAHVFDRFYRADTARDRSRAGSGIGLTIARALVLAHGGTIAAASPGPGRGATFTVRLPRA